MRAKSVYENLGFERHKDPIESMGIGCFKNIEFDQNLVISKKPRERELVFNIMHFFNFLQLYYKENNLGGLTYIKKPRDPLKMREIICPQFYLNGQLISYKELMVLFFKYQKDPDLQKYIPTIWREDFSIFGE